MSPDKRLPGPKRVPVRVARIDDHLVDLHAARETIMELLDSVPADHSFSPNEIRVLRRKIRKLSKNAVNMLLEVYTGESTKRGQMAFLILSDMPEAELQPAVARLLTDANTSREHRVKLLALGTFDPDRAADSEYVFDVIGAQPSELIQAFTAAVGDIINPEELAHMWLEDFWDMPPEEKTGVLGFLLDQATMQFLPAIELEAQSPHAEVRQMIAHHVRKFPCREALLIANALTEDKSPTIRYDAQHSLDALTAKGELPWYFAPPKFDKCVGALIPNYGVATLVYSVRDSQNRVKFCSLLLDTWNRGIVDIWGNVGLSPREYTNVLKNFADASEQFGLQGDSPFEPVSKDYALYLIQECAKTSGRRNRKLPLEYHVWNRLFRHESVAYDPAQCPFSFELRCGICESLVLPNRNRTNIFIDDDLVICRKCLQLERKCTECKDVYRLKDIHDWAVREALEHSACESCLWGRQEDAERT